MPENENIEINGKMEALLNLALQAEAEERSKSADLEVGYDPADGMWELIVKYNGEIGWLRETGIQVEELVAGIAIVKIKEQLIPAFTELDQVEYIEKPKRLSFASLQGKQDSCALSVALPPLVLRGAGVLIGIIDSGGGVS